MPAVKRDPPRATDVPRGPDKETGPRPKGCAAPPQERTNTTKRSTNSLLATDVLRWRIDRIDTLDWADP